ncbi:MAG TPA: UDP-N-acetylmuramoyl-L-alanyl-D-glutamate--2,6-diaminopimelate ligase [bacterium]|nr:UDP-N-acetylmuramoyl-L-alanyl-D-glutamate--2,6-diaminopimelate ligase [bacterium]
MRVRDLVAALAAQDAGTANGAAVSVVGDPGREFTGLSNDSRSVRSGDLFAAIRGFAQDGHRYAADAVRRGAAVLLVDHPLTDLAVTQVVARDTRRAFAAAAAAFYRHPSREMRLCGITGTNGKTTTTFLIDAILRAVGRRSAVIGTLGVQTDGAAVEFHATTPTTPEASDLQRLLREMADRGVQDVTMEVTSHALELDRVAGCRFVTAVFTNLTQDHLDLHGTLAAYRDAKARLFAMVDPDGVGIVNADDPYAAAMAEASRAPVWTYGVGGSARIRAEGVTLTPRGTTMTVVWPDGRMSLALPLPGRFNVSNALAAFAVGLSRGVPADAMRGVLATTAGVPGRFEPVDEGQPFAVIVDYAHTPDSLEQVLRLSAEIAQGRRIVVFGCGGDRDRTKRPIMGRIGTTLADYAFFTSDNPRSEDPDAILREIEAGVPDARNYASHADRRVAIEHAIAMARPGDVVVIAGKGHETYQIVGDRVIDFDDRAVAREVLRARFAGKTP